MTEVLASAAEDAQTAEVDSGGANEVFWASRTLRLRRRRLVGFALCVPLWALSAVLLARESMEGRDGLFVYLAAALISLGVAASIRGVYVLLTKRRFLSPWIFVLAAVVAIVGSRVQGAGEIPAMESSSSVEWTTE